MPEAIGQLKFNPGKHLDGALDAAGTFKGAVIHCSYEWIEGETRIEPGPPSP